jgi:hypothetical protein
MNKYKIYPWIPILGIFLVFLNIDKTITFLENPTIFFGSGIIQAISLIILVSIIFI